MPLPLCWYTPIRCDAIRTGHSGGRHRATLTSFPIHLPLSPSQGEQGSEDGVDVDKQAANPKQAPNPRRPAPPVRS